MAAAGAKAAQLAGRVGDGLMATDADAELVKTFREAGGGGKPRHVEVSVCWAESEAKARRTALEVWPLAGFSGPLTQELALPAHFEKVGAMVTEDAIAEAVVCGPDPARHVEAIRKHVDAGFDHVYVHQIGPEQEPFLRFYEREVLPAVRATPRAA